MKFLMMLKYTQIVDYLFHFGMIYPILTAENYTHLIKYNHQLKIMKLNRLTILAIFAAGFMFTACNQQGEVGTSKASLDTKLDSVSYALGFQNGTFLSREGITEINMNDYNAGIQAGLSSDKGALTQSQVMAVTNSYLQELQEKRSQENMEEGKAFLEENLTKEGVQETESGLQYKVLEEGDGASPSASDVVRVHYTGRLIDGTIFDTSIKEVAQENGLYSQQREPYDGAQFPLNRVIPGWTEGVQLMKEGAKYEFYIPSDLAYGTRAPQGSPIGPNETLIFEVELLEVQPAQN